MHTPDLDVRVDLFLLFGLNSPHAEPRIRILNNLQILCSFPLFQRIPDIHLLTSETIL